MLDKFMMVVSSCRTDEHRMVAIEYGKLIIRKLHRGVGVVPHPTQIYRLQCKERYITNSICMMQERIAWNSNSECPRSTS